MKYDFENVEVPATIKTPFIRLNKDEGIIELRGRSIPENTVDFYYYFNRWLSEYSREPAENTRVILALQYLNSSSSVVVTNMMKLMDGLIGLKSKVSIDWYYERDDVEMRDLGNDFKGIMKCPFSVHEVDEL